MKRKDYDDLRDVVLNNLATIQGHLEVINMKLVTSESGRMSVMKNAIKKITKHIDDLRAKVTD